MPLEVHSRIRASSRLCRPFPRSCNRTVLPLLLLKRPPELVEVPSRTRARSATNDHNEDSGRRSTRVHQSQPEYDALHALPIANWDTGPYRRTGFRKTRRTTDS